MVNYSTIDEYLKTLPVATQDILQKIRHDIKQIAPNATETISYGIPTFKLNGKNMVHFAGYQKFVSLYPTPSTLNAFKKEISAYIHTKGAVQFPLDKPIPHPLIAKMVQHRLAELAGK